MPKTVQILSLLAVATCMAGEMFPAAAQTIENSDVYVTASELADEVELIREVMGRPFDDSARLPVAGITQLELYFQAQTLLIASNRLAHELADAELISPPPVPAEQVLAADVLGVVTMALDDVRRVRRALGITEMVVRDGRDTPIAPTGVFSVVLDTNRQLDLLLQDRFDSADVYQRLTVAVSYAAGVLERLEQAPPRLSRSNSPRLPADVYRHLLETLDLVIAVNGRAGVESLALSTRRNVSDGIEPADVYHLAQFLVADLTGLARALDATPAAVEFSSSARHIFPSHTYVLAELLRRQLEAIDQVL